MLKRKKEQLEVIARIPLDKRALTLLSYLIESGVHAVFSCGHVPARDLFNRMDAFLDGVRAAGEMYVEMSGANKPGVAV